jgi:ATP-dependent DNA helicase RecG
MTSEELKSLISKGESDTLEFKTNFNREAVESCGAFANTHGGHLLIGVARDGTITGAQIGDETFNQWRNQVAQSSDPIIIPDIESHEIDGKTIAAITVQNWPIKPVAIRGRHYKRVGNSNRVMNAQEVTLLHFETTSRSWDYLEKDDSTVEDIDINQVNRYMSKSQRTGRKQIGKDEDPIDVLKKLHLIKGDKPTFASLLLFGKEDRDFLSQAAIHCGRFLSETNIDDDRMITGTLVSQIEDALEFVKKHIKKSIRIKETAAREEVWEYPLDAIREAIINAVCHRDYTLPSNTDIRIFDDSINVWNPGGLPQGLSVDDLYKPHPSILRNKGIGAVLYDMGYIEQWGSGMERMRRACLEANLPEPRFEEYQGGFGVTFSKDIYSPDKLQAMGLNERQVNAINYVIKEGKITNKVYRELTDISDEGARIDLKELVEKGILIARGKGRSVHYILHEYGN